MPDGSEAVAELEAEVSVHEEEGHGGAAQVGVHSAGRGGRVGVLGLEQLGQQALREQEGDADGAGDGVLRLQDGLVLDAEEDEAALTALYSFCVREFG